MVFEEEEHELLEAVRWKPSKGDIVRVPKNTKYPIDERFVNEKCRIVKRLRRHDRTQMSHYDVCYSYICPMTEERVRSRDVYEVEWCDPERQALANGNAHLTFLLACQLVPHFFSWPDRKDSSPSMFSTKPKCKMSL